jgi:SsrA-binding protein
MGIKIISNNKKAFHEYEIVEKLEAGIELKGTEVKSLRNGKVNLSDGWVSIDKGEAILKQVHISHYSHGNIHNHLETRERKLLLHQKELIKLERSISTKGLTLVPLKIYLKKGWFKLEVGLGKGKKLHDKRQSQKKKDADRQIARALKG